MSKRVNSLRTSNNSTLIKPLMYLAVIERNLQKQSVDNQWLRVSNGQAIIFRLLTVIGPLLIGGVRTSTRARQHSARASLYFTPEQLAELKRRFPPRKLEGLKCFSWLPPRRQNRPKEKRRAA